MSHQTSRTAAAKPQPPLAALELDALLLDDQFDDDLDRQLDAIRESLADFRSL
jgi:hypothetical protein